MPRRKSLLTRLQDRARRARPGSVLIIVIALLVLLALIATAFITTARTDRTAVAQHGYNTEVDLLMQGVITSAAQGLLPDLFAQTTIAPAGQQPQFRPDLLNVTATGTPPIYNPNNPGGYNNTDGLGTLVLAPPKTKQPSDSLNSGLPLLADRTPVNLRGAKIGYRHLSGNPMGQVGVDQFANPYNPNYPSNPPGNYPATYDNRLMAIPDSVELPLPTGGTRKYPGLRFINPAGGMIPPAGRPAFLAADTDGDGIADAALFQLPYGPVNGITYYAAIRILDNSSAINAAVAMEPNGTGGANVLPGLVLPTNIDLVAMYKKAGDPAGRINFVNGVKHDGVVSSVLPANMFGNPYGDNAVNKNRTDFAYTNVNDALWSQLGSRLGNPGFYDTANVYHAFPTSEAMVLARRFCLADPDGDPSLLEQALPMSIGNPTTSAIQVRLPYNADQSVSDWWPVQFNSGGVPRNLRPLTVVRNPVTTFAPGRFVDKGAYQSGNYNFGDRVYVPAQKRTYICIDPSKSSTIAPDFTNNQSWGVWAVQPWTIHPTKISVNTATFGQLCAAYWAVFARHPQANPKVPAQLHAAGSAQFKSPIRDKDATNYMSFEQVRQLRSALAALNTMDLRDGDHAITSRTLNLTDGPQAYTVNAFGGEKQPFITEAIVQSRSDGKNPYVAIELTNPYTVPITFSGMHLAFADHPGAGGTFSLTDIPYTAPAPPASMPAGAHWVFESNATAMLRPTDLVANMTQVASNNSLFHAAQLINLAQLGTKELYLVRYRKGTTPSTATPYNNFAEPATAAVANPMNDLVPLDQLNFTGIYSPYVDKTTSTPTNIRWHYARNTKAPWQCVWPGMYFVDPLKNTFNSRDANLQTCHEGWNVSQPITPVNGGPTMPAKAVKWGKDLGNAKDDGDTDIAPRPVPIQFAVPTPNNPDGSAVAKTPFPYGGFARPGDILSIPFIGGYTIRTDAGIGTSPVLEMISPSMDAVIAEDSKTLQGINKTGDGTSQQALETTDDKVENIGHFCPIDTGSATDVDYSLADPYTAPNTAWRYNFAMDLFDYLDVRSPQDDYLPNVGDQDIIATTPAYPGGDGTNQQAQGWMTANKFRDPVSHSLNIKPVDASKGTQDNAPDEGKININTAPWQVLSALDLCDPTLNGGKVNRQMAEAITYYRDVDDGSGRPHGPFRTIWELMKVKGPVSATDATVMDFSKTFGTHPGNWDPASGSPTVQDGDYTPLDQDDQVIGDYEGRFMALTRISGMITTRSDYFTGYAVVQGWRGANTDTPELVVQRRLGFIADRTGVAPVISKTPTPGTPIETKDHTPMKVFTFYND